MSQRKKKPLPTSGQKNVKIQYELDASKLRSVALPTTGAKTKNHVFVTIQQKRFRGGHLYGLNATPNQLSIVRTHSILSFYTSSCLILTDHIFGCAVLLQNDRVHWFQFNDLIKSKLNHNDDCSFLWSIHIQLLHQVYGICSHHIWS